MFNLHSFFALNESVYEVSRKNIKRVLKWLYFNKLLCNFTIYKTKLDIRNYIVH